MLSTTDCINRIQSLIDAGGEVTREQVAELVWAYAAYCRQVNEKAKKCLDLLRQGRRTDARKLAKEPPDLEQELNLLDFPEREEWLDLCEGAGLPIRQSLDTQAARSIIQEVYGDTGRMDQLLRTFRRMSLGQAPLADRLRMLRAIRRADPDHDFWEDDVRAYETARLEELVAEAKAADTHGDLARIEQILGELRGGEWLTPPTSHINGIEKIAGPHRRQYAYGRFRELLDDLHRAHGEMDDERCRRLLAEWQGVIDETGVEPDQEMREGVAPVEAWLDDVDAAAREDTAYQKACAGLEKAIDDDEGQQTLEQLAAEVFRFERGMPELLAAKFNTRIEELKSRSRRRFALALTGIVGGLALVAVAVTFVVLSQIHQAELEDWQQRIAGALEKDDLDSARKMLKNIEDSNPELSAAPEIVDLRLEYGKKDRAERLRREKFEEIKKRIESQGPDEPDEAALARAEELVKDLQEKQWVQDWELKYKEAAEEARRLREAAFKKKLVRLKDLHAAFREAERERQMDLGRYITPVLELADELLAKEGISDGLMAQVTPIRKHASQAMREFEASAERRKQIKRILGDLPVVATKPGKLEETLSGFAEQYSDHRLASDFAKAGRMAPHWQAAEAWRTVVESWDGQIRLPAPTEAEARIQQIETYLQKFPEGPFLAAVQDYLAYLKTANRAFTGGRFVGLSKVKDIFTHVIFTPALRMIRTKDGKTFYILKKDLHEQRAGGDLLGFRFRYITSMNLLYEEESLNKKEIAEGPVPAPQTSYSKSAGQRLSQFKGPGWETFYLELAGQAVEQDGVDPVLKGQILQLLLGFAASSTPFQADWIERLQERISAQNLDFVEWLNPNVDSDAARNRVKQLLDSTEPFAKFIDKVRDDLAAMERSLRPCQVAGVLLGQSDRIHLAGKPPDGTLFIIWAEGAEDPSFEEIGKVKDGKVMVRDGMTAPYPEGTPVYIRPKQENKSAADQ